MAYTAGFSVNVGDPTKASDVTTLAANDDFLKAAVDAIMADSATPSSTLKATVVLADGVTATTQSAGNNTTRVAPTAFVKTAVDASSTDPAGSNTQIQYNNSGAFGASANLTFDGSTLAVTGALSATGNVSFDGGSFVFNESGADKDFRIEGDGNANLFVVDASTDRIGIGTATPATEVEVAQSSTTAVTLRVQNTNTSTGADRPGKIQLGGKVDAENYNHGILEYQYADTAIAQIIGVAKGSTSGTGRGGALRFFTKADNGNLAENMHISASGLVGIGTTSPDGTLHVHTASCGTETANALGSILVLEDDDNNGMSILTPDNAYGQILWGSPSGDGATGDCNARIAAGYNSGNQRLDISVGQTNSALTVHDTGNVAISGALSKGSGSFRIDHPLPEKTDTHHLVHSFVEGPQADLIYRGTATLNSGTATINLDTAARMTDGTFVELNTNVQAFTSNESGWDAVRGSVSGNVLTIASSDNTSTASVSWLVIGERKDVHMIDTNWTDSEGRVITEPQKPAEKEDDEDGAEE